MAIHKALPIEFVEEIKEALGLKVDIIGVIIRSLPRDLVTVEIMIPMEQTQDRKVTNVLRRYKLVPLDPGEKVPTPTADTLTPAPFDPTP
jgi:hypothetical protein